LLPFVEGGPRFSDFQVKLKLVDPEKRDSRNENVSNELESASDSNDGLRALHLTKSFGKLVAVENVTFGVRRGEVFALLGPNGAGKTTTISLIRGDTAF
jgi:ATP-binding cassette, subfamily A (ABC1), member 3